MNCRHYCEPVRIDSRAERSQLKIFRVVSHQEKIREGSIPPGLALAGSFARLPLTHSDPKLLLLSNDTSERVRENDSRGNTPAEVPRGQGPSYRKPRGFQYGSAVAGVQVPAGREGFPYQTQNELGRLSASCQF